MACQFTHSRQKREKEGKSEDSTSSITERQKVMPRATGERRLEHEGEELVPVQ